MTVLPIARMGAEVLKQRADEVSDFTDPALGALINDIIDTMINSHGVGLAAPQVFAPKRIVLFFVPASRNDGVDVPLTVMINPIIHPATDVQVAEYEACLSVPGLTGKVPRWTKIRYSFQDISGARIEREAVDFHARVVQHECDHLDGMLYPLRMTDLSTLAFVDALQGERGEGEEGDEDEIVAE